MALLNAMLIMALFTMLLATGIQFTQQSYKAARSTRTEAQVYNVARAGLVDAINWFKREATQPVTSFKPFYNAAVPTKGATNDPYLIDPGQAGGNLDPSGSGNDDKPSLGIVQEYPLDVNANIYARYEIGKITKLERGGDGRLSLYSIMEQDNSGAWVKRNIPDARSSKWEGVQDVSDENGLQGQGLVWRIRCHAYIYKKDPTADSSVRFYQYPNEVLDQIELETEIRRLQVKDYLCAIHANGALGSGTSINFNDGNKVKVVSTEGYGLVYNGGSVNGNPSYTTGAMGSTKVQPGDQLDWGEMFALPDADAMAAIADFKISATSQLPAAMSTMAITYIKPAGGTAVFNQQRPLNGGGLLICDGNLTIAQGSASTFAGVIYVTGNYNQSSPSAISGQVIVKGSSTVSSPSDTANVEYNPSIINEIRRQLGQYRERRTGVRVTSP